MEELEERLKNILLAHYLPSSQKQALNSVLQDLGIARKNKLESDPIEIQVSGGKLRIGNVETIVTEAEFPELVPSPLFFDIPKHKELMRDLLEDMVAGEKHLLLIGTQGVGKNKIGKLRSSYSPPHTHDVYHS